MTDDLVKRLRDGCSCNIDSSPCMAEEECRDAYAAADRIEELEAKLEKQDALMGAGFAEYERRLAKAVGALEKVQAFVRDLEPHADQGHTLVPALREACETLAELKGETDD